MSEEIRETGNPDDEVKAAQKKYCSWAMTSAIMIGFSLFLFDEKAIGKGLILGTLFSIINFILLGRSIPKSLGQSLGRARAFSFSSILLRYCVLAIPLIVGVKQESFNFIAVAVGLFSVQLMAMLDYIVLKKYFNK